MLQASFLDQLAKSLNSLPSSPEKEAPTERKDEEGGVNKEVETAFPGAGAMMMRSASAPVNASPRAKSSRMCVERDRKVSFVSHITGKEIVVWKVEETKEENLEVSEKEEGNTFVCQICFEEFPLVAQKDEAEVLMEIHSLTKRPDLNGRAVAVQKGQPLALMRLAVKVLSTGNVVSIKADNLRMPRDKGGEAAGVFSPCLSEECVVYVAIHSHTDLNLYM